MAGIALTDNEIAKLTDEQLSTMEELGMVASKKLKLSEAIEEFNKMTMTSQKQMGFSSKEDPDALHEDPEIQQLVTIKVRYKMGNLNEQIRRILRRCIELDLHKFSIIQRQCKIYKIDCPEPA